jgi:hypothetical protein
MRLKFVFRGESFKSSRHWGDEERSVHSRIRRVAVGRPNHHRGLLRTDTCVVRTKLTKPSVPRWDHTHTYL